MDKVHRGNKDLAGLLNLTLIWALIGKVIKFLKFVKTKR